MYLQTQTSDPLYHYENYGGLPVAFIMDSIKRFREQEHRRINAASHTAGYIATAVYGYLSKGKNTLEQKDFLPYQILTEEEKAKRITLETAKVFVRLYEREQIPPKVLGAMGRHLEAVKNYGL